MNRRPRLTCVPSADREFAAAANALLSDLVESAADEVDLLERFAVTLRRRFPTSVVRARHPLAEIGAEPVPVWYAIRPPYRSRLTGSIEIAAPPELVYEVYVRPDRVPQWQRSIELIPLRTSAQIVGDEYEARYRVLGKIVTGTFRVVDAERPTSLRVEAEGAGIRLWYATMFTETPSGTHVAVEGDYDLPDTFLARVADRLFVERAVQTDIDEAHGNLKTLCEVLAVRDHPDAVMAGPRSRPAGRSG